MQPCVAWMKTGYSVYVCVRSGLFMLVFYAHTQRPGLCMCVRVLQSLDYACVYVFYKVWTMHVHVLYREVWLCMYMCCTERSGLCMHVCVTVWGGCGLCMSKSKVWIVHACERERGLYYACVCARVREVVWTVCTCERGWDYNYMHVCERVWVWTMHVCERQER